MSGCFASSQIANEMEVEVVSDPAILNQRNKQVLGKHALTLHECCDLVKHKNWLIVSKIVAYMIFKLQQGALVL